MEEEQIITVNDLASEDEPNKEKGTGVNKTLMGIIVFLLLVISGGGAYFFGTNKKTDENSDVAPTESPFKTETLGEETEDVNQEDVNSAVAGEATPTTDPLITPSITPIISASPTTFINPNLKIKDEFKIMIPTSTPTPKPTYIINPEVIPEKFQVPQL